MRDQRWPPAARVRGRGHRDAVGLEVVALLVEDAVLAVSAAEGIGRAIQVANPKFITMQILDRFLKRIGVTGPRTKR